MTAPTTTTVNRVARDFDKPLWRRLVLTRESAIVGLLLIVAIVASVTVKGFAQPLTLNYLLLDIAPILLIVTDRLKPLLGEVRCLSIHGFEEIDAAGRNHALYRL